MSKKQNVESIVVNTKTIAKIIGVTERRVRQLVEEGVIDRVGHGRFNLIETINKYIVFLKLDNEENDNENIQEKLDYEKYLHEKAKREKAEMELAHLKKQMHHASEVEKVMNQMLSDFRARLLGLPSKVAPSLVAREDINLIESLIQKEVYEALTELSEYDPSLFGDENEDEEDDGDEVEESEETESVQEEEKDG